MKSARQLPRLALLALALLLQTGLSGQSLPAGPSLASQYLREAQELCERDGGKLWGVSLCGPILFVDRTTRTVFANQSDREGVLTRIENVFTGKLPATVNIANTAIEWAGVRWTMIIFPPHADRYRRDNLIAHELWHRIQDAIGFPSTGAANKHLASRDGRIWLQLEWRALAIALTSRAAQRHRAIVDAVLFRAQRRAIFPEAATEEREMEMHEGLAEYTGVMLSGRPDLSKHVAEGALKEAVEEQTFVRSFAYASGPAYGLLLDTTGSNWRTGLTKKDDLGALLRERLRIGLSGDLKRIAEMRARNYDGDKLLAAETERENVHQKLLAEYRAKLVDGPVLVIPLQKMNMQFNPGKLVPLDSLGTVYPDIRVVDVWGILTASKGALMNSTYSRIYVSAPGALGVPPLSGDGWSLELNDGWTVTVGARQGDYIVRKLKP